MMTSILRIPNISCEHCEHTIQQALTPVSGVQAVMVDIPTKEVEVVYDESMVGIDRLKEILQEEEYPVESVA